MIWTIYKIENRLSGKAYIGITRQPVKNRWKAHYSEANCGSRMRAVHAALRAHGLEAFTFEVIGSAATAEEATAKERMAIVIFGSVAPGGYNLTAGGEGTESPALETRQRMRAAQLGRKQSAETIEKRRRSLTGRKRNPDSIKKSADARRGVKRSDEFRAACRERAIRQFSNPVQRAKVSASVRRYLEGSK